MTHEHQLAEALRKARDHLLEVGNDYPGSSCQKWCADKAREAWSALRPWTNCPSTHCERTEECRSVNECSAEKKTLASYDSNAFRKDNGDKDRENPVEAPTRIHFLQTRITELEAQIVELTDTRIQAEKRNNALAEELRALGDPRRLDEIPIGLFMANGELCLKTEYREPNGAVSAFIVSSGEFFCGPSPQTVASQNADTVTPVSLDFVLAALEGDE